MMVLIEQALKSASTLDDVKAVVVQLKAQARSLQTEVAKHISKNKEQATELERVEMERVEVEIVDAFAKEYGYTEVYTRRC